MTGSGIRLLALLPGLAAATPALAHTGSMAGGFIGGFAHPLFGLDHALAMVAVGLWGAFLGQHAIFILPVAFPLVMAVGGVLGTLGVALPAVEVLIAGSALVLGMMVALAVKAPLWSAGVMVGAFALFHGHAHGAELPPGADAVAYSAGFVIATGLRHLAGVAFGLLVHRPTGRIAVRAAGAAIAVAGAVFLSVLG